MRAVLHRDRVRVRIVRYDRKGRPEGRVLDIIERRKAPIIGRLLHEAGIWLVAPKTAATARTSWCRRTPPPTPRWGRWCRSN
jgi:exoribonuclease R